MAGERLTFDNTHRRRDGSPQHVQITLRRVDFAGRPLMSVVWQDVTEARRHADRIRRLNQAYAVLSGVNEAIVRLPDVAALQAEVCRIAVDVGGFRQACIGRAQAAADDLLIEACCGPACAPPPAWGLPVRHALQGDAPLTPAWFVEDLIAGLQASPDADMATPVLRCDGAALNGFLRDFGNPEVCQANPISGEHDHVLRLDIAVNHVM